MTPTAPSAVRTRRTRHRSVAISAIVLLSLVALSLSSSTVRAASPVLTIVSPTEGAVVANGTPVIVRIVVSNFTFVQPGRVGQVVGANEGHANVFVDAMYTRLLSDPEPFSLVLSSGPHTIRIQLVASDGTALTPDVTASVHVTATHGPAIGVPTIHIVSPTPKEATGHGVYLSLTITNFTLVEPRGQPNAQNEGHILVFVDQQVVMESMQSGTVLLVALPDGDITLTAKLVNNDNTPLNPDVSAAVRIHVTASTAVTLPLVINGGVTLLLVFILVVLILRRRKAEGRIRKGDAEDAPQKPGNDP